jgi:hypothetical protein
MKWTEDDHLESETLGDKLALAFGFIFTAGVAAYLTYYLITHPLVLAGHP